MNDRNQTVDEQLHEIKHLLKVLSKGQEQIKSHLWRQKDQPEQPSEDKNKELVRQEAINYINNIVMPEIEAAQAEQGDFQAAGVTDWVVAQLAKPMSEYLKARAIDYIGQVLGELKKKAIPYAVKIADWILDKIEDIIVNKYKEATEEQQKTFREEIDKTFPNSRLLGKLSEEKASE